MVLCKSIGALQDMTGVCVLQWLVYGTPALLMVVAGLSLAVLGAPDDGMARYATSLAAFRSLYEKLCIAQTVLAVPAVRGFRKRRLPGYSAGMCTEPLCVHNHGAHGLHTVCELSS